MAEIPTLTVPDVQPRPTPAGEQRVNTPPQAFGALSAGESLKGTGQALAQGADATFQYAKAFQDLNNKAAADTANSEYSVAARKAYDNWAAANPGAKGLSPNAQGVTPLDQFGQDLAQLRGDIATRHNLSPIASSLYDQDSRRLYGLVVGDAGTYAKQQQTEFWKASSSANIENYQNQMAMRPTDLNFLDGLHSQIAMEVQHLQTITGMPNQEAINMTLDKSSEGLSKVVSTLGVHDPMAAADLQHEYEQRGWISPKDKDALDRTLHAPIVAQIAAQAATGAFSGPAVGAVTDPDATLNAIMHAESGGRNLVNYKEQRGEAGFTASGYYQITDPTWKIFAPPDVSAKYPRAIDAPFDVQQSVAHTILAHQGTAPWAESQATWGPQVGAAAPAPTGSTTPPSGSPLARIESSLPQIQADAKARADALAGKYGIDKSEMEVAVEAHVEQQYSKTKFAYDQQQTATQGSILAAIDKGDANGEPISDMNTLFKIPGMKDAYSQLVPTDQWAVDRMLAQNANAWSIPRQQQAEQLKGLETTDPSGFLKVNPLDPSLDLRRVDRIYLANQQTALRSQMQKAGITDSQKFLHSALGVPAISLAMPKDPGAQAQYVGALTTEIEGWQAANPGKVPSLNDYNAMAQKISTSAGGVFGIGGHPAYVDIAAQRATVPEAFRAQVRLVASQHGMAQPTEAQIEDTYRRSQH